MDQLKEKVIEYAILLGISIALIVALLAYSPDSSAKTVCMPAVIQAAQNPSAKT